MMMMTWNITPIIDVTPSTSFTSHRLTLIWTWYIPSKAIQGKQSRANPNLRTMHLPTNHSPLTALGLRLVSDITVFLVTATMMPCILAPHRRMKTEGRQCNCLLGYGETWYARNVLHRIPNLPSATGPNRDTRDTERKGETPPRHSRHQLSRRPQVTAQTQKVPWRPRGSEGRWGQGEWRGGHLYTKRNVGEVELLTRGVILTTCASRKASPKSCTS